MRRWLLRWLYLCGLLLGGSWCLAEDTLPIARENHLADLAGQFRSGPYAEEVVELGDSDPFFGLRLRQRTATPQGGILILHDQGHNPNWPNGVRQSRRFLPEKGWNTLSISLPFIPEGEDEPSDETAEAVLDRIALGQRRLNQEGQFNIVLLGFGDGAYWAARYLAERLQPDDDIGYALLMVDVNPNRRGLPGYISALSMPILDLVQSDEDWILYQAQSRQAEAARNKKAQYSQILDAPNYHLIGSERADHTVRRLWGWLKKNAAGREGEINTQARM